MQKIPKQRWDILYIEKKKKYFVAMAIALNFRYPSDTALQTAVLSAQIVSP